MIHARLRRCAADIRPQAHPPEFSGGGAYEVVKAMWRQLSWESDSLSAYMTKTADRVEVMHLRRISTWPPEQFLADLAEVGIIHIWSSTPNKEE